MTNIWKKVGIIDLLYDIMIILHLVIKDDYDNHVKIASEKLIVFMYSHCLYS